MRIALAFASLTVATMVIASFGSFGLAWAERSRGLSLEQIRGVMRAHAAAFNACLRAAPRGGRDLHGPFLYDIEVDKTGKVTSARPYQPSGAVAFDKCITSVIKRARFPGGPATVETPIVFDPS